MHKNFKEYAIFIVAGLVVIGGIYFWVQRNGVPGKLDVFASCLKDKGATFYGAFWCPHCKATKSLFGNSAKLLPYVECSTPDGNNQIQACKDNNIKGYPTWVFFKGISIESQSAPHECTNADNESVLCKNQYNTDYKVWIFPDAIVGSQAEPTQKDGIWAFAPNSRLIGELTLETLAKQTGCVLPQ